ncbi:hypothetical protein CGCF415_v000634 [Colletotrichum fructicola]|uniref:Uncharacterized protein n=2 Tax=Colletotrichum gloeosporioides species complex TaxID=2707338 RepID=L2FF12_COLFN|nr:uncharacterized protein CGMCC3_g3583 [Colletotrichum fructicola]XP_053029737.1 uncharacterized protein COL26b_013721 [Colletotrichum chrysophilum]KAF4486631.1 hypothetical protein CGGC5_v005562 [Colletotrichum fructicola Nara gc5]KAF4818585.1 hypothetical protein CGCTS75_v011962 [Colletotrichum tropicale]KAI8281407.1 hypothetical protein K4K60_004199 [Colletotrichum sp. SAR11_57]KAI8293546.1 hypothetical protein K4K56_004336 [Colletotrichum sp. SAR 10_98]KAE9580764.1 hypothetical protein C
MKFLQTAAYALMASQLTAAAPLTETDSTKSIIEFRTPNDAYAVKAALEQRTNVCRRIGTTLRTIGTSHAVVIFMTTGSDLVETVCRLAGGTNCEDWAKAIRLGFLLIYGIASGTSGAVPETNMKMKREEIGEYSDAMRSYWENTLIDTGLAFDSVSVLPFDEEVAALEKRDDADPKLLARIHFSGLVDSETGKKHEIIANHFEGNNTVLHLPGLNQEELASRDLSKRAGAAGFKISYTTRKLSLLTRSHQSEMSGFISAAWALASANNQLEDYIGFASTDHSANFYYRIIPELYSFGLNYESVDICGGMASFL